MPAADAFSEFDYLARTLCYTSSATRTLVVIDLSNEVFNNDSSALTSLFAQLTAYTARIAEGFLCSALLGGNTADEVFRVVRHKLDDILRAGRNTHSASLTLFAVDHRNAVNDLNSIELALCGAGTKTETTVRTGLCTASKLHCRLAVRNALIFKLILCNTLTAAAHYLCAHTYGILGSNAHDLSYFIGISTDSAGTRLSLTRRISLGKRRTA